MQIHFYRLFCSHLSRVSIILSTTVYQHVCVLLFSLIKSSSCRNAEQFIPSLCEVFGPRVKADQVTPLLQALDFTITLNEELPSSTCRSVGRVLGLLPSKLNLILKSQAISVGGLKQLFKHITHLQKLRFGIRYLHLHHPGI